MNCPACGTKMNHHADKVDYEAALREEATVDPELGGVVEQVHTCPGCGRVETVSEPAKYSKEDP
jgi:ribosomal protein S27AE